MQPRLYAATLTITGTLRPHPDGRRATITTDDGTMLTVKIRAFQRAKLTPQTPTQRLELHLWPRTDHTGQLLNTTQLYKWRPATQTTNRFTITGRLVRRKKELSRAVILIRRNQQGNLTREFTLETHLNAELAHALPRAMPPGIKGDRGLTLEGFLVNGYLVAVTLERSRLAEPKPIKERRGSARPQRHPSAARSAA